MKNITPNVEAFPLRGARHRSYQPESKAIGKQGTREVAVMQQFLVATLK